MKRFAIPRKPPRLLSISFGGFTLPFIPAVRQRRTGTLAKANNKIKRTRAFVVFHSLELGSFARGTREEREKLLKLRHRFFTRP